MKGEKKKMEKKIFDILIFLLLRAIAVPEVEEANWTVTQKIIALDGAAYVRSMEPSGGGV
jgi:hypothetical protein